MEEEIKNLKLEIKVLKQRVANLEAKERTRKIVKIIKAIIIIAILVVMFIYGYKWYQEMMNYYESIKNALDNPLQAFIPK